MAEEEKKQGNEKKFEAHVSKYKAKVVKELVGLMKDYPIIGAVNMEDMPASALQSMRSQLRDQVVLRMTKRRVMKYAFEEVKSEKKDVEKLIPHLKGMPALLFTKENPFKLFKVIKKNKTPAPAKAGQEAPKDIIVKTGATPFAPGPVIGELGAFGIKTEVKDGKIHIKEDSVVAKEGDVIDGKLAGILTRLGIQPMELGLDLTAVYEDGVIYDKKVLDIDEEEFMNNLNNAVRWAFNLAVETGHFTKETINVLVPKAFREAKSVALEANIINDITREEIIGKAERQAVSLKTEANIPDKAETPAEPKEEKAEEKKSEEKKEEEPKQEKPAEPAKEEKAEKSQSTDLKKEVEKAEKEVKEELKELKEEIKEEAKAPEKEEIEKIEKKVEETEKKLEEAEEKKSELPSTEKVILDAIEENKEKQKEAVVLEKKENTPERKISQEKKKQAKESEKLFDELKKKGTLRNVEEKKFSGPKTPEEIIKDAHR